MGRDLDRREQLAAQLDRDALVGPLDDAVRHRLAHALDLGRVEPPPDHPLGREHHLGRVDRAALLGAIAHDDAAVGHGRDHRRDDAVVTAPHHRGATAAHDRTCRVGRAQVDAQDRLGLAAHRSQR
ncbi:MAG: hypothetical protein U0168_28665 [Nannocystaceae bacterium]